eukprot:TRINITY_DN14241_c0_g1_i6.p1 TRINITY_DN14241_c0_g1~~TRINITY_DN14241_c0_g1_i6.p1  ORF type:complete len:106 (+),score=20.14 TRINITY_DN14241_c0_g1_i6:171-488(+)
MCIRDRVSTQSTWEKKYYKEHEKELLIEYEKQKYDHDKKVKQYEQHVVSPASEKFCYYFTNSTLLIFFCRKARPKLVMHFLQEYEIKERPSSAHQRHPILSLIHI